MKLITGLEWGKGGKLYTTLSCTECGSQTYTPCGKALLDTINKGCKHCYQLSVAKRREEDSNQRFLYDLQKHRLEDKSNFKVNNRDLNLTVTHGNADTFAYKSWQSIFQRCYNPAAPNYIDYGGRGIVMDLKWHDFKYFMKDMGERPEGYSIDRINNDLGYYKDNCRWVPMEDNASGQNRRTVFKRGLDRNGIGWWKFLGLEHNPYIYGPMPWKRISRKHRRAEAIERGWFLPPYNN